MRSPSPSFLSELQAYQKQILATAPTGPQDWERDVVIAVLNRWMEHPEAEAIWGELRSKLPTDVSAAEFAYQVVERRLLAEKLGNIIREAPTVERKMNARTKRLQREKQYLQLACENTALGIFTERRERLLGRQKSAPRRRFMWEWGEKFKEFCGQPLDEVVRVLTEIAFGEGTTLDAVRGARRPSTRAERQLDTRPPK